MHKARAAGLSTGADGKPTRFIRLVNGTRGGYLGYATWRKYLDYGHAYTAAHADGMVKYTAHELRHVCASLLIASGASDTQVCNQMGHKRIETTKNVHGHLFACGRTDLLKSINAAVSRLTVSEATDDSGDGLAEAV